MVSDGQVRNQCFRYYDETRVRLARIIHSFPSVVAVVNLANLQELQTSAGLSALARAAELNPTDATLLACVSRLRSEFPASLAAAALETTLLRRKATGKFTRAADMFFTREALEQSSSEVVSRYRAERFAPFARVADLCCGIGGDTIGLAADLEVIAVDNDPLHLAMAEANVGAYGCGARTTFLQSDVLTIELPTHDGVFADPDRRSGGKRHVSIKHYQPSIAALRDRLDRDCPLGIKVAPGVPHQEIEALDAETEFISVDGELKECVLWFGPLRSTGRRATLLPSREMLFGERALDCGVEKPLAYLYDPDPAVVRAGFVTNLANALSASLIDEQIAFLTSAHWTPTPFATAYRIDEEHPFHLKKLAERLRALKVGRITVIKRGSAVEPETVIRRCKLDGPEHRVVILTRAAGKPTMLIGERILQQPNADAESSS